MFDGTVTGSWTIRSSPAACRQSRSWWRAGAIDSLDGDVTASPDNVHLRKATVVRGSLRARFDAEVALEDWKARDTSQIFGNARHSTMRPVTELLAVAEVKDVARDRRC